MRASERPNRMVNVGSIPSKWGMAVRASAITHLGCELISMWVRMAVHAEAVVNVEVESRM